MTAIKCLAAAAMATIAMAVPVVAFAQSGQAPQNGEHQLFIGNPDGSAMPPLVELSE